MAEARPQFEVDDAIVLLLGSDAADKERKGEIRGITRLEKLVFLLEKETSVGEALTEDAGFEAYNFGPFSKKVYSSIDQLVGAGLVTDSKELSQTTEDTDEVKFALGVRDVQTDYSTRNFHLTKLGFEYYAILQSELSPQLVEQVTSLRKRFAGWRLRELVRYVYQKYDAYTEKSLIRDEILGRRD